MSSSEAHHPSRRASLARALHRAAAILALALTTSCAAMFTGTTDTVRFESDPPGAEVVVDGEVVGTTPCTSEISKSVDEVEFRHAALGSRTVELDSSFQVGFVFMDILFTPGYGLLGILVDTATQAWWNHPDIVSCDFNAPVAVDVALADGAPDV